MLVEILLIEKEMDGVYVFSHFREVACWLEYCDACSFFVKLCSLFVCVCLVRRYISGQELRDLGS